MTRSSQVLNSRCQAHHQKLCSVLCASMPEASYTICHVRAPAPESNLGHGRKGGEGGGGHPPRAQLVKTWMPRAAVLGTCSRNVEDKILTFRDMRSYIFHKPDVSMTHYPLGSWSLQTSARNEQTKRILSPSVAQVISSCAEIM
jgi:hypothetical protein